MRTTSFSISLSILSALLLVVMLGCNKPKPEPEATPPKTETKAAAKTTKTEAAKAAPKAKKGEQNFTITTKDADLKVGEKGMSTLLVEPGEGFKINEEYPWKAKCAAVDTVGIAATEAGKDAWKMEKKKASLDVDVTPTKAGDGELKCSLNFSVCNDSQCELIRDHEVKLKLAAK